MLNILILIKKLPYIINNKYGEIICAKYDGSSMNDACTICPADFVSLPAKVVWLTAFFLKKKAIFCTAFVLATSWTTWESAHELCFKVQHLEQISDLG